MAFWTKKSLSDCVVKYLNQKKITVSKEDNKITFEVDLASNNTQLYPYIVTDEQDESLSIIINIRKINQNENVYFNLNEFNKASKYFTAKLSNDGIIYLEYNIVASADTVGDIMSLSLMSLNTLSQLIDTL